MRRQAFLGVLLGVASLARAEYPPEVEVVPILKDKRPHLPVSKVAVSDCYSSALAGAQREEVALVKVTVRGPWERTAQHLAAEKAAELGANCLHVVTSSGKDNSEYPVLRSYKAFRVMVPYGPWRVPASAESLSAVAASASATVDFPLPKLKMPVIEKKEPVTHGDHLSRAMGEAVYAHNIVLDPAHVDPLVWEDVAQDVREYFGEVEAEKLARLVEARKAVRIDLRLGKVSAL